MPNQSGTVKTGTSPDISGTNVRMFPPAGYYDGATRVQASDTDLIAGNIKSGVNIFGLIGTLQEGKKWAMSTVTVSSTPNYGTVMLNNGVHATFVATVTGLAFTPKTAIAIRDRGVGQDPRFYFGVATIDSAFITNQPAIFYGTAYPDNSQTGRTPAFKLTNLTWNSSSFSMPVTDPGDYRVIVFE
jgi:hypothetical protein